MRRRPHVSSHRPGAAIVELAVLLPLLVFLFVAGVDFARVFYHYQTVTNCARNGAQYGSIDAAHAADTAGIQTAALNDAKDLSPAPAVASETGTDSTGYPCVRVTATWTFQTVSRYPGIPSSLNVSRTVQMRIAPLVPKNSTY